MKELPIHQQIHRAGRRSSTGVSAIELALILPILLIMLFGVAEYGRAILFNNVLINMSREGANLASRTSQDPQFIIDALNHTSAPLNMEAQGMVYITRVAGIDGTTVAKVQEQHQALTGATGLQSKVWSCPSFTAGKCNLPAAQADLLVTLPLPLRAGAEVHVVETIYDYAPLTRFVMSSVPDLYSRTIL